MLWLSHAPRSSIGVLGSAVKLLPQSSEPMVMTGHRQFIKLQKLVIIIPQNKDLLLR